MKIFAWQVMRLVRNTCWSAYYTWSVICNDEKNTGVFLRGRCSTWWNVSVIFRGSVTFRGRWIFGDNSVSLFVGGIPFGEMQVSFFVVSAALGKILNARLDAKYCIL